MGYGLWDVVSAFWYVNHHRNRGGKRVWEQGFLEGVSGFFGRCVSELKRDDVPKPIFCFGVGGVREPSPSLEPLTYWPHQARLGVMSKSRK